MALYKVYMVVIKDSAIDAFERWLSGTDYVDDYWAERD